MKKQYKIFFLIFLMSFAGFSNEDSSYSKQKTISKAYIVNNDAGITIDNSYGSLFVTTWNEDKIEIEVIIKVSGDNEKWVNQKLESISVDFIGLKNMVTAKTVFDNSSNNNRGRNNNFEINYTIKIPKNGSVKLNNKYGNISTTDLFASTTINCKYGKINLGRLNGNHNDIEIGYCSKSTIDFIKQGTLTSKYSSIKTNEVSKLSLFSDYSDIEFETVNDLKFNSKYGSIKSANVNSLDGSAGYLTIDIGILSSQLTVDAKYSSIKVNSILSKAKNVTINAGYTGINMGYQFNYMFDFDINTKYSDFKFDTADLSIISREETNNTKQIKGFHKKKGENKITISSNYGNVKLIKNQ
jgi:hypothetical protein